MVLHHKISTFLAAPMLVFFLGSALAAAPECTAEPGVAITRLGKNPRLFVSGNFHNKLSTAPVRDLAYVSTIRDKGRDEEALSVLLSNQDGCFRSPAVPPEGQPPTPVGKNPSLIATGKFDGDDNEDIVIISGLDQFNRSARLRVFRGDGQGHFMPVRDPIFPLAADEVPVAMAIGHFRSSNTLDIAIATANGILNILHNNGNGVFEPSPPISLDNFQPEAMIASDRFRDGGKTDLVIKGGSSIIFLQNSGDGNFRNIQKVVGAGGAPTLLLGVLDPNDAKGDKPGDKLDIITYDEDMSLKVFANDGFGVFQTPPISIQTTFNFNFAKGNTGNPFIQFFVTKLGNCQHGTASPSLCEPLQFKAIVTQATSTGNSQNRDGILTLTVQRNNAGFSIIPDFRLIKPLRLLQTKKAETFVSRHSVNPSNTTGLSLRLSAGIVDQFMSLDHGELPALALIADPVEIQETSKEENGTCGGIQPERTEWKGSSRAPPHGFSRSEWIQCINNCTEMGHRCPTGQSIDCKIDFIPNEDLPGTHDKEFLACDCTYIPVPNACRITKGLQMPTPVLIVIPSS
ncbi:hypothetical protein [Methylobacter luteus]|uniref:hypothetical protein n=1 Tax=Methylobacter luteus TaxID=415 RepID=UPI00041A00D2|nr:hypothetical protein [Methylobacter luteus]